MDSQPPSPVPGVIYVMHPSYDDRGDGNWLDGDALAARYGLPAGSYITYDGLEGGHRPGQIHLYVHPPRDCAPILRRLTEELTMSGFYRRLLRRQGADDERKTP